MSSGLHEHSLFRDNYNKQVVFNFFLPEQGHSL